MNTSKKKHMKFILKNNLQIMRHNLNLQKKLSLGTEN